MKLENLNLLDFGHTIQITGVIFSGNGEHLLAALPGEKLADYPLEAKLLHLSLPDWEKILYQTDVLNVEVGPAKAIVRKSQRQIDQALSWRVFRRDNYACQYCGRVGIPLTVDHIDLWEAGGLTIEDNLLSACRPCNRTRGNLPYEDWLRSKEYREISRNTHPEIKVNNLKVLDRLPELRNRRRQDLIRSR